MCHQVEDVDRPGRCIQALGFRVIERLLICGGLPCYDPEPRIIQSIKLDVGTHGRSERSEADLTVKKAFEDLFDQLARLGNGYVGIEVRHGLPVRLVMERSFKELV